jgi:hypothetical protein
MDRRDIMGSYITSHCGGNNINSNFIQKKDFALAQKGGLGVEPKTLAPKRHLFEGGFNQARFMMGLDQLLR